MWVHQSDRSQQYLSGNTEAANWREIKDESGFVVRAGSVVRNGNEYGGVWMRKETAELICAAVNACRAINPDNPLAAANAMADAVAALEGLVAAMDKRRPPVGAEGGYTGIFGSYEFDGARKALAALKGGEQ